MNDFFKYVFASMLGFIFAYVVIFVIAIFIMIGTVTFITKRSMDKLTGPEVAVKENSVMKISFDRMIMERTDDNPFLQFDYFNEDMKLPLSLKDIVDNIHRAKDDKNIKGIELSFGLMPMRLATMEEIRNALLDFKKSGKFIFAYSKFYTDGDYFLASVADSIYMQRAGMFIFKGFTSEQVFFRGMFDKLEIEPRVIRHGKFKAAGEMLDRYDMSPENRLQVSEYLFPLYAHYLTKVSEGRGMDTATLGKLSRGYLIRKPADAVTYKLVNSLVFEDEYKELLKKKLKADKVEYIDIAKYKKSGKKVEVKTEDEIALIYAIGEIGEGSSSSQSITSDGMVKAIRSAAESKKVKAIVLRVSSPGGLALSSDIIAHELEKAKEKKPLVVSMGDVAASGGYYIACPGNVIYAQPTTLTGSIGVIGFHANLQKFWKNKIGVTFDRVKTGPYSDLGNFNRTLPPAEEAIIQVTVEDVYSTFVNHVAKNRKLRYSYVDSLGQGRVWSGQQALNNGLVDKIGGLDDAIKEAATLAKIKDYKIRILPKSKNPFEFIFGNLSLVRMRERVLQVLLGVDYDMFCRLRELRQMQNGIYMVMPSEIKLIY